MALLKVSVLLLVSHSFGVSVSLNPIAGELLVPNYPLPVPSDQIRSDFSVSDISNCQGDEKCCLNLVNNYIQEISRINKLLNDATLELIFANIRTERIAEARQDFLRLNNDTVLNDIVSEVYEPNTFENLVKFVEGLFCPLQTMFYKKLYETMDERSHLLTFNMVIMRDLIEVLVTGNGVCAMNPAELESILRRAESLSQEVKSSWAASIRSNHFDPILETANQKEVNHAGNSFTKALPDIVIAAYDSNNENLHNILTFLSGLTWNGHKLAGISKLSPLLSGSDSKLKLALKMKVAMDNLNGPDGNEEAVRNQLLGIKSQLPQNVRGVVWHDHCYLRNEHYGNEYLYAADSNYNFNALNGRVFTWTRGTDINQSPWRFEAVEKSNGELEFRVLSDWWTDDDCKLHLGAHRPDDNYDGDRGYVSASCDETDKSFNWRIEYTGESNQTIRMFHPGRNSYFYASQYTYQNNDRRYPFLWLPGVATAESDWTVECTE